MSDAVVMVEFRCGACGSNLRLPACLMGQKSRCPSCRGTILVPDVVSSDRPVAHRLCSLCATIVPPETVKFQGLEEIFCPLCLSRICAMSDSTILRDLGIRDEPFPPTDQ